MAETKTIPSPSPYEISGQWFVQHSGYETLCSALSLLNTLRTLDPSLLFSNQEINDLLSKTPLNDEDIESFLESKGYESFKMPISSNNKDKNSAENFGKYIANVVLTESPLFIRISSKLSKKKETKTIDSFSQSNEHKDKLVVHRVVARKLGDRVEIIDPYDPEHPEIFQTDNRVDMQKLVAWLFSVHFDQIGRITDSNLSKVLEIVTSDEKFDRIFLPGAIQAGIKGVRHKQVRSPSNQ